MSNIVLLFINTMSNIVQTHIENQNVELKVKNSIYRGFIETRAPSLSVFYL